MRSKTSKILLLTLLTGLTPLSGFARVHKAATKAAPKAAAKTAATRGTSATRGTAATRISTHAGTTSGQKHAVRQPVGAAPERRSGHGSAARVKLEPVAAKGRSRKAVEAEGSSRTVKGRGAASLKPAQRQMSRSRSPEPIAEVSPAAEPLAESHALPEIHVTHNRKQHLKAAEPAVAPEGGAGDTTPIADAVPARKARPQDFLTAALGAAPVALTGVSRPDAEPITTSEGADAPPAPTAGLRAAAPPVRQPAPIVRIAPAAQPATVIAVLRKPAPVLPVAEAREKELLPPPVPMPALYSKSGRLIMPAAMKGSHDILIHQNLMADQDGLDRIQDDDDLMHLREAKLLVALPEGAEMRSDERLPANRRYARPWTVAFLNALAKAHYARFHEPLQVNSAVRTVEFQVRLIRTNGNAAPAEGDTASPHLTGQAVDLAKHGLSVTEIAWMRGYLLPLVQEGRIDVEEEFQQACFHISVYRKYLPQAAPGRVITPHRTTGMALAAAME